LSTPSPGHSTGWPATDISSQSARSRSLHSLLWMETVFINDIHRWAYWFSSLSSSNVGDSLLKAVFLHEKLVTRAQYCKEENIHMSHVFSVGVISKRGLGMAPSLRGLFHCIYDLDNKSELYLTL
jgi:hypothetical protein